MTKGDHVSVIVAPDRFQQQPRVVTGRVTSVHSTWFEIRVDWHIGVQDFASQSSHAYDFRDEGVTWCAADDETARRALEVTLALTQPS